MEGAIITAIVEGAIQLGDYLASLPEKDREVVKARLRSKLAETATDISDLAAEIAKTKAAREALPKTE